MTREIIQIPERSLVQIRLIEDDGVTCLSEPCYPLSLFQGQNLDAELEEFADGILLRTVNARAEQAEAGPTVGIDE
jgi:hypothetical protein